MELVRWEQVDGVNRIQSRINELFEDTFGRTRANRVLPLEPGILPWTFLKVRIHISFAPSCPG